VFLEHNGFARLKYAFGDPATRPEAVNYAAEDCPNAAEVEKECFLGPHAPHVRAGAHGANRGGDKEGGGGVQRLHAGARPRGRQSARARPGRVCLDV